MTNITYLQSLLVISIILLSFFQNISCSANTLVPNQSLVDNQTLVSEGQRFELGFFIPINSKNRYLRIWYKNISPLTVVWVANRNTPLTGASGVLKMDENGNLLLLNQSGSVFWSSNQSKPRNPLAEKPGAKLFNTGNLVVTEESDNDQESYLWQSFDHATDTLLPGMKLGWDLENGVNNFLVSWKSVEDPSTGDYSLVMESHGSPEIFLLKEQTPIYRTGPWNGIHFSGLPEMSSGDEDGIVYSFVLKGNQNYYSFSANETTISRLSVDASGQLRRFVWLGGEHGWTSYWDALKDQCEDYKDCGAYGICNTNDLPVCTCVKGFEPNKGMKLPDCSKTYYDRSMNLRECKEMSKKNCSCTAYANSDIRNGGSGCIIWIGELVDLREYAKGGQDLYVRVAASELDNNHKSVAIIVTVAVVTIALLLGLAVCFISKKKRIRTRNAKERVTRVRSQEFLLSDMSNARDPSQELKNDNLDLHLIEFDIIAAITENFSDVNKLGQGGFGSVYKGTLADGKQIAVKRLSKYSGQGVEEFKNEVMLIAKLQHRNLVRLLSCCIDGEEKMLIYKYMPNKSLDCFLFDKTKSMLLDWGKRFDIIMGIARGLLYLHQDSRFRIIHRDLKADNILLDQEMNPKISDFGMARIFGGDQTEANTRRVVGTYGYMSPEYAMDAIFSVKSDVFSYGVLVLAVISGKKNRGFYSSSDELNFLVYAWRLWQEGKGLEFIDEAMGNTCCAYEVLKCIHVGLLC